MTEANQNSESQLNDSPGPATGKILKEKRLASKIELQKICNDLRVTASVIEAIESGNYHLLPGDPYIRALLGSLGRYLNLDTVELIRGYNREMGTAQPAAPVAPYKDRAHTYTTAHKQIFVAIFLGLFVVLFLIIAKLNKGEHDQGPKAMTTNNGASADSLAAPVDTLLESRSLIPDSMQGKMAATVPADSGEARPKGVISRANTGSMLGTTPSTGTAPVGATTSGGAKTLSPTTPAATSPALSGVKTITQNKTPTPSAPVSAATTVNAATVNATPKAATALAPATAATSHTAPTADTAHQNIAIIKPILDSVGIKVLRTGKEDFTAFLRTGKQIQLSHNDTITVYTSKPKSVEVIMDGKSVIPGRKRFKIFGNTLKTY